MAMGVILTSAVLACQAMYWRAYSRLVCWKQGIEVQGRVLFQGRVYWRSRGLCQVGDGLLVNSGYRHNPSGLMGGGTIIVVEPGARLSIGRNVGISNSTLYCKQRIDIGDNALIGTDCKIYDYDFHSLFPHERSARPETPGKSAPVTIENDVFIGTGVIILKGVRVGQGAVIAAGAVLTRSVPAGELWAGNPARRIRRILP